ncbi:hypothetical protein [Streptomyces lydicus]|uniref:hypothetical protein n=1 Tax=Streptomyces lydicus TaxID=47763 RepID=UPI0037A55AA6
MSSQPQIPPSLAAMVADSKKLSDDLTLTGRDLLEARAKDAAREAATALVGGLLPASTTEEHLNQIADVIAAPLVKWLRGYDQANDYVSNGRDHFGKRCATAERKLEHIEKWAGTWDLSTGSEEELRHILASPDGVVR